MLKRSLLLLPILACGIAWSQTTSGSIAGVVQDAQGAVIQGASISAQEVQQKFILNTKSDDAGRFVFAQVPAGT